MPKIFDGETLVAHYNPGVTPFIVVTFIGAFHEHAADTAYLMKEAIEADNITCVGITSRTRNLYISDELKDIAAATAALRQPDQKLIVLGQSSGGYAAIKFAALFKADCAVAFAPIFSLDESDLGFTEEMAQERSFLEMGLRFHRVPREIVCPGMHPSLEDCPSPLLVVYDIHNQSDHYSAGLIEAQFPTARFVRARNIGHAALDQLDQNRLLFTLLRHLSDDDMDAAYFLLRRLTRNNETAVAELMVRIARWRPSMVEVALRSTRARETLKEETRSRHAFNTVRAYQFVKRGMVDTAISHLSALYPNLFQEKKAGDLQTGLFLVISWHGDLLTYDSDHSRVVLLAEGFSAKRSAPAILDMRDDEPRLIIQARSSDIALTLDESSAAENGKSFSVVPVHGSMIVAFRRGGHFLRGAAGQIPVFDAAEALDWEQFALVPIPESALFRERAGLNWFDETLMTVQSEGASSASRVADADSVRRKIAFRSFLKFFGGK